MRYSVCCIILSSLTLFISCRKREDVSPLPVDQVKIATIISTGASSSSQIPPTTTTYTFSYDELGRIIQVNDKHFYYGSNGKVAYSRIRRQERPSHQTIMEHVERLHYHWDAQGRLDKIVLDSLYRHLHDQIGNTIAESLNRNIVIATYTYSGNSKLPSSIEAVTDYEFTTSYQPLLFQFEYEGENLIHSKLENLTSSIPPSGSRVFQHSWFRYDTKPNYLFPAYTQLGFHPYLFYSVVSTNGITQAHHESHIGDTDMTTGPDWLKATTFHYAYNSWGYPTQVKTKSPTNDLSYTSIVDITYQ